MTKCFHLLLNKLYFFSLKYALEHAIFIHFYNFDSSFSMDHITILVTLAAFVIVLVSGMHTRGIKTQERKASLIFTGGSKLH